MAGDAGMLFRLGNATDFAEVLTAMSQWGECDSNLHGQSLRARFSDEAASCISGLFPI